MSFGWTFEDSQRWAAPDRVRQTVPGARCCGQKEGAKGGCSRRGAQTSLARNILWPTTTKASMAKFAKWTNFWLPTSFSRYQLLHCTAFHSRAPCGHFPSHPLRPYPPPQKSGALHGVCPLHAQNPSFTWAFCRRVVVIFCQSFMRVKSLHDNTATATSLINLTNAVARQFIQRQREGQLLLLSSAQERPQHFG